MIYCPSCGAELIFDIKSQMMLCEHCKNSFEPGKLEDNTSHDAQTQSYYESYAYICPSCGADIETTDKNDAVGFCPYCKGSSMIFDRLRREWKPDGIVPFKITKEQCKELYCKEVKRHFFVSKKFRDPDLIEDFRAIYMPYSRFIGIVDGEVAFKAKSHEEYVGDYNYRTNIYDLKGQAHFKVTEKIAHDASAAFDDHISERLGEYDETDIKNFHPAYLSGFYAESGNVDMNEYIAFSRDELAACVCDSIKESHEMKDAAAKNDLMIESDYSQNVVPMKIIPSNHRLFPVWFMSYRQGKKITYAAVNGQTGKVAADLPLSPWKILITALVISAVIFGGLSVGMSFLPTIPASATLGVCTMLGLIGTYLVQHGYLKTVGLALHQKEFNKRLPFGFVFNSILALVGIVLVTTDGTYTQLRYSIGILIGGFGLLSLASAYFLPQVTLGGKLANVKLEGISMQSNGILVEAKRFNIINFIMRAVIFATNAYFIWLILTTIQSNGVYYLLAAVSAAELFGLTIMHIIFQTKIATRRLPQFNKKGAAYDQN